MVYAYVTLILTNKASFDAYREQAGTALKKHGGAVVAASPNATVLEGTPAKTDISVILSFPDKEAAVAWREDPELAHIHALRQGAGETTIVLVA